MVPYLLNWPETHVGQFAESEEECPDYSGQGRHILLPLRNDHIYNHDDK